MGRFPMSAVLTMLLAATAEAQTTTSTTSAASSVTTSPALAIGPLATPSPAMSTPPALGVVQALPGSANGGGSSAAAAAASSVPDLLLCLPDAPVSETLLPDTTLFCGP
jgi:hypothetical protein